MTRHPLIIFVVILVILTPSVSFAATMNIPTNTLGLVGHWTFDGSDMAPNVRDRSGYGNHGNLFGQTSTSTLIGKIGQALNFDGINDYVQMGPRDVTGTVSVSAWIYLTALGLDQKILGNQNDSSGGYKLGVYTDNKIEFEIRDTGNNADSNRAIGGGTVLSTGRWYHVVGVYDDVNDRIATYVNGSLDRESLAATRVLSNSGNVVIGKEPFMGAFYWNGRIDDVRIYNRVLSAQEIKNLYNSASAVYSTSQTPTGLKSGLVGNWTFDGKDMTPNVRDRSGQGNHGNLAGQISTSTATGRLGQALSFDGVNDKVTSADLGLNTNATYTLWIKPNTNFGTSGAGVFDTKPSAVGAIRIFGHTGSPAQLCWDIGGNSPNQCGADAGYGISDWTNQWHFLAVALSAGNVTTLFVDGLNVGTVSNSVSAASNTFEIGFYNTNFFNGVIDDVRAYNRVLSNSEINQLYAMGGSKVNSSQNDGRGSLNTNLVALWSFDGKDMTPRVMDRSGNGYNGTINGQTSTTTTIGKLGQALSFDGVNDYVSASPGISYAGSFSVSFWAKVKSNAGSYKAFVIGRAAGQDDYSTGFVIDMGPSSSSVWDYIGVEGQGMNTNTDLLNTSFDFNTWHHIVVDFTVGSNTVKLYADGILRDTRSRSAGTVNINDLQIGARNYSSSVSGYFDGAVDDVRIYSKSLSAAEVKQLYNMGR